MLKLGLGIDRSVKKIAAGTAIDPDAQAFFNRVTAAGGTLTATEETAVNLLVLNMKTANVWNLQKAVYPMVGSSAAACKQNLKSASFTGTFTSGWTFASNGASTIKSSGSYMDTGILASSQLSLNNTHISYYNNLALVLDSNVILGDGTLSNGAWIGVYVTSSLFYSSIGCVLNSASNANSQGYFLTNKPNSTNLKYIKNSTIVNTIIPSNTSFTSAQNIFLNNYDSGTGFSSGSRCAFASIGNGMTDTQAFDLYASIQSFNTALSRQV
jgi:hypothetical protein